MPRANQLSATAPVVGAVLPVARTALDAGQLETARRLYRRLLDVAPQSFEARMGLGEVAHQRRDGAEAMRWFLGALANATTVTQRHDALLHHGRAALDAGQMEHAQASFARLTDPQEAASNEYVAYGLNGVGLTLLLSGDLRSSVTLLEQAVDRLPGDKKLRDNLARALQLLAEEVANAPDDAPNAETTARATPYSGAAARPELQAAADRIEQAVARFEEAAERLADTPRQSESPSSAQTPAPAQAPAPAAQTPVPSAPVAQTPAPPPAQPDPSPAPPPKPQAPVPRGSPGFLVVEGGRRFVQMGAYGTATKANALAERLQRVTEQSVTVTERGGLHRVRIGPLRTEDALRALTGALQEAGYGEVRLPSRAAPKATDVEKAKPAAPKTTTWQAFAVRVGGETFLQIGAFAARATAVARETELRELLATSAMPVRVVAGTLPSGKTAHRVRVGPLHSDADLATVVDALAAAGRRLAMPKGTKVATNTGTLTRDTRDAPSRAGPAGQQQDPRVPAAPEKEPPPEPAVPETPPAPAPQQTPTANSGAAAAAAEVVEAALAAAEQIAATQSQQDEPGGPPPPTAEPPGEPPAFEETLLARGVRATVITQDEGVFFQIGDYDARADAGELASRLRALTTEAVQVVEAVVANAPLYRVHIGPVETDADYQALAAAVASLGFVVP